MRQQVDKAPGLVDALINGWQCTFRVKPNIESIPPNLSRFEAPLLVGFSWSVTWGSTLQIQATVVSDHTTCTLDKTECTNTVELKVEGC